MKILALSDSHGNIGYLERICDMHSDADLILFAGDGISDIQYLKAYTEKILCVHGNRDAIFRGIYAPAARTLEAAGKSVYLTHGHHLNVKLSYGMAERFARDNGIDILVFGHTHIPFESCRARDDGGYIRLFNPGAVKDGSFGLIMIDGENVLMSHGVLK